MIYNIPEPKNDIAVVIISWCVKEVVFGSNLQRTQHLLGYIKEENAGRVTSAIQCFDQEKMIIKTSSGRVYQLYGEPSTHGDALYVWANWKNDNDAHDELDVTHQIFQTDTPACGIFLVN